MWDDERIVENQPSWITQELSWSDVAAICQGGCASGAYMPAVTYHQARKTMSDFGDDVLQYIEEQLGELPQPPKTESWSGMACFYLSYAVGLFASCAESNYEPEDEESNENT